MNAALSSLDASATNAFDVAGRLPESAVLALTALCLLVFAEFGYRRGMRLHLRKDDPRRSQISGIQGAVLGLLALLLGFTMAMALERFELRRTLVVQEANDIGTTYLRASMLPEAHRAPVRAALRRYVDVRLAAKREAIDPARFVMRLRESAAIHDELWRHAVEAASEAPTPVTSLFVESLNSMIDTDAERLAALRANIPGGVWVLVIIVAAFGTYATGFSAGSQGARTVLGNVLLPVLITVVIVLIFDLANPARGIVLTSQQPLIDLKLALSAAAPK